MRTFTQTEKLTADIRNKLLVEVVSCDDLPTFNTHGPRFKPRELEPAIIKALEDIDIESARLHYLVKLYKGALETIANDDEFAKQIA